MQCCRVTSNHYQRDLTQMKNIKAAIFQGPKRPLTIETVSLRAPGPDEVLVRLKATGLCHSDLHILDGHNPMTFPMVLGHECCGVVEACGDQVRDLAFGDLVIPYVMPECGECILCKDRRTNACITTQAVTSEMDGRILWGDTPVATFLGLGTFAEYVVVKASRTAKIDPRADREAACYISCGAATGLGSVLLAAKVKANESVAVFGLGGIGLNVVQGARLAGAKNIIGIDVNPAKEAVARQYGATDFICTRNCDDVPAEVARITGMGADHTFDCVGNPAVLNTAFLSANPLWGECHNIGIAAEGDTYGFDPRSFRSGGRKVGGVMMGNAKAKTDLPQMVNWDLSGKIDLKGLISHRLRLEEINEGFDLLRAGQANRIVITF